MCVEDSKVEEFRDGIELAVKILKNNTGYKSNKELIDNLFDKTSHENVALRLTVIDSLYSTNMSMRLFGIQDLASAIMKIGDDEQLKHEIEKYKDNQKSEINSLLSKHYGINKRCEEQGEARSLISKYLYFVTDHDFPIEDSLVKDNANAVCKYYGFETKKKNEDWLHFLISFHNKQKAFSFDEIDKFMWLIGKINKGSLSLIVDKENFKEIFSKLEINAAESEKIDAEISRKLKNDDYIEKISAVESISSDLINFLHLNKEIHKE